MKALPRLAILGLLFGACSVTLAQVPGTYGAFTAALTLTHSKPGTVLKDPETGKPLPVLDEFGDPLGGPTYFNDWFISKSTPAGDPISDEAHSEFISKMATRKYSNKEILLDLVAAGAIEEIGNAPFIAGWSLIVVTDEFDDFSVLYARHTSGKVVDITPLIQLPFGEDPTLGGYAQDVNFKYVNKMVFKPEDIIETETVTDVYKYKEKVSFIWMGDTLIGHGILTGGGKLTFINIKDFDGTSFKYPVYVPGASKVSAISGIFTLPNVFDPATLNPVSGVIEGTLSAAGGKVIPDIDAFLFPPVDP
ncbi:MAG TPA: hypothetical protein DIT64_04860 [Verrucomicrobiales bacterium]|nr:hypothetical protein [Verrucomicrobiales bacterium]HCN76193.1 hypothetical protein [Verrucomicrobiales bacterium]HRJ07587.1 hypothetical protein [Prosthecobacter sp.]HRK14867.1 hypothetical protein [Prosthecobacter sp.]